MISAGNDIIDLQLINAERTITPRFYKKFITNTEAALYDSLPQQPAPILFEHFIWLLWSIKESVYKLMQRHDPTLIFSPVKIVVEKLYFPLTSFNRVLPSEAKFTGFNEQQTYNGTIICNNEKYYSRSVINHLYITTIANNHAKFQNVYWGTKYIQHTEPANQSKTVREFALKQLACTLKTNDLQLNKTSQGCPVLLNGLQETELPVSLAHHGHYVAYSFLHK